MNRFFGIILLGFFAIPHGNASDIEQHLRDQYQGKIFVLRGFYSNDRLRYDSAGSAVGNERSGDWTSDGFIALTEIHTSGHKLKMNARRMLVVSADRLLQLQRAENQRTPDPDKRAVLVEIEADLGSSDVSAGHVDAVLSKIFLNTQDAFEDMVPEYWKPCVPRGLIGEDANCHFSPEILAIPGVARQSNSRTDGQSLNPVSAFQSSGKVLRVGNGVQPPRTISAPEPEFSERARAARFEGTLTLALVVSAEGVPTNVRILNPLGCGLDVQAVHAVEGWKFRPAEKDGQPVPVSIAVEVDFHLF